MKKNILLIALPIVLAACSQSKEDIIVGKWQAVKVDNPQQDSFFAEQDKFLDTFGRYGDAAANKAVYGFSNVDSARESLKAQLKDYKAMQQHAVENTVFNFDKKGTAIMDFSGQVDTVKWTVDKEGKYLTLEESKKSATSTSIKMEVIELTKEVLKLKFTDNGGTSTVTFKPAAKK